MISIYFSNTTASKDVLYSASTPINDQKPSLVYSSHYHNDSANNNTTVTYVSNRVHIIPDEGGGPPPYMPPYGQQPLPPNSSFFARENSLRKSQRSYDSNRGQGSDGFYSSNATSGSCSGTTVIRREIKPGILFFLYVHVFILREFGVLSFGRMGISAFTYLRHAVLDATRQVGQFPFMSIIFHDLTEECRINL